MPGTAAADTAAVKGGKAALKQAAVPVGVVRDGFKQPTGGGRPPIPPRTEDLVGKVPAPKIRPGAQLPADARSPAARPAATLAQPRTPVIQPGTYPTPGGKPPFPTRTD